MRRDQDIVQKYISGLRPQQSSKLKQIEASLRADEKWGINIGSTEGFILQWLIQSHQVKNIVEVGTQYGYSTQWMLEVLPENGNIYTHEKSEDHYLKAKNFITDPRVHFYLGSATDTLKIIEDKGPFDLVFIDANKKSYPEYSLWAQRNVKKGGLIVGDNTFLFGQVFEESPVSTNSSKMWTAMREFNQQLFNNKDYVTSIIPTAEGLTVSYRMT